MNTRQILLKIHLLVGCIAAPFLFIVGASGALVVFEEPYTDGVANASLTHVTPGTALLSLDAMRDSIRTAIPDAEVRAIGFHSEFRNTYAVSVITPKVVKLRTMYVDPWRGHIVGDETTARRPLRWAHTLHTRLLIDPDGKRIVGWTAVALVIISLSGLWLWWPGKIVTVRRSASNRRQIFELHNTLGALSWVFLLILGVTGVVVHWEDGSAAMIRTISDAALPAAQPKATQTCATQSLASLDVIRRNINDAAPGAYATSIQFGDKPTDYAMARMRFPEDKTPAGRTLVLADRCTGRVVWTLSTRTAPVQYRFTRMWNRSVHTGDLWGWPTRILALIVALLLPVMALTGPLIWWSRRANRARYNSTPGAVST